MNQIYPWQTSIWQHLVDYITQERIPQALLFSGLAGLGKRHLADRYAELLLCWSPTNKTQPCGTCGACQLLAAGTHPDYILIAPDEPGKGIGIDKIRQLISKLALKPQFANYRVIIFEPADSLNTAAANAFLKCLEEPGERTCFILLSDQPAKLPATIRSRCQKVAFAQPELAISSEWLQQQGITKDQALLLKMATGSPLLAKNYAAQGLLQHRQNYFAAWESIANGKLNPITAAEQWQKAEAIDLELVLNWMISWLMDIIKLNFGLESQYLTNLDLQKPLHTLTNQLELQQCFKYYDLLQQSAAQLSSTLNKQLVTEQLLITWHQLNKPTAHV